jgi:hypothetical protein
MKLFTAQTNSSEAFNAGIFRALIIAAYIAAVLIFAGLAQASGQSSSDHRIAEKIK